MNNKKCCVVFVTHKSSLEGYELKSFQQCLDVFSPKRDIKLVIPNNISTEFYDKYSDKFEYCKVNHEWLSSYKAYNKTCCTKEFYELFKDYEYMLKYEADAWVFEDRLDEFIKLGYDYYGAPWPFWDNLVGNGGFSLRNVNKMIEITSKSTQNTTIENEDTWFIKKHGKELNVCPWELAANFSLETPSRELLDAIKTIPMGFHGAKMFPLWDNDGTKFKEYKNKIKTAICCIGRMENQYAREFVEHYKSLGFDKIFIYDNNYDGEEHFEDVLKDFIDNGYIEIINVRNKRKIQTEVYNHCYNKYRTEYDWIAFFDFDEFLILEKNKSIASFLKQKKFTKYNCILINWMNMDDNGMVFNNHEPLMKRFTHPIEYDKQITYNFPENNTVKSIIKCGNYVNFTTNPHIPSSKVLCCDAIGNSCDSSPFKKYTFQGAYLKHFSTKTIEEWLGNKMKRGYPDGNADWFKKNDAVKQFFKVNDKTDKKIEFIKKNYAHLFIKKDNLDIFICTHKKFESLVNNETYKVVDATKINNDTAENGLGGSFYSELMSYKYVLNNWNIKDYIGFCSYRKYFNFLNDIPDLDKLFSDYDCIVSKPIIFNQSVKQQYSILHNIEDLYLIGGIIADKFPTYTNSWHNFINGNIFIPYNMFIMKKDDFKKYIEFIFGVLDEYVKIVGTDIKKRIEDNKEKYLKDFYPNNTVEYQYRIGGYLGERLTNVFLMNNFTKMKTQPIIITENKYKK